MQLSLVHRIAVSHFSRPVIWSFDDIELYGWFGVANAVELNFAEIESDIFVGMFIEPLDGSSVLFAGVFDYPNDDVCRFACGIGQQFAQMIVIAVFDLILDDNRAIAPRLRCIDVDLKIADR